MPYTIPYHGQLWLLALVAAEIETKGVNSSSCSVDDEGVPATMLTQRSNKGTVNANSDIHSQITLHCSAWWNRHDLAKGPFSYIQVSSEAVKLNEIKPFGLVQMQALAMWVLKVAQNYSMRQKLTPETVDFVDFCAEVISRSKLRASRTVGVNLNEDWQAFAHNTTRNELMITYRQVWKKGSKFCDVLCMSPWTSMTNSQTMLPATCKLIAQGIVVRFGENVKQLRSVAQQYPEENIVDLGQSLEPPFRRCLCPLRGRKQTGREWQLLVMRRHRGLLYSSYQKAWSFKGLAYTLGIVRVCHHHSI